MEIVTKQFELNQMGRVVTNQFMIDEDYNVPDSRRDVKRIIMSEGNLKVEEVKPVEHYLHVSGKVEFQVLYEAEAIEPIFCCMSGSLPFHEMIYLEEGADDQAEILYRSLDIKTSIIHSRKIRVKGVAELGVQSNKRICEEIPTDVHCDFQVYKKQEAMELLKLHTSKRDTYRIKETLTLPGTKESIGTILWSDVSNRKLDTRLMADQIQLAGELLVFCFYESPDGKIDWVEQSVPYAGKVECYGVDETMFHHIQANLEDVITEIRMDEDGETRVVGVEGTLKLAIGIYEEEQVDILLDLYSTEKKCLLTTEAAKCEQMLLQNHSKCKVMERLQVPELKKDVLQVCHSKGRVLIEESEIEEDGILMSGALYVSFLYVKSDDAMPFDVWSGMVPFSHLVECGSDGKDLRYDISTMLEQLSVTLQGGNEIEVKAALAFHGFFRKEREIMKIKDVQTEPISMEELEKRPSIVGYIVKEGDDLWKLAKYYNTSVEAIREMNELGEDSLKKGERLLIFKENMSIL